MPDSPTKQTKPNQTKKEKKSNREYIILKPTNLSAEQRTKYQTYFHLIYSNDHQLNHWPTLPENIYFRFGDRKLEYPF